MGALVLRAAGVNIYHLLWPALILGVMTTVATGALYYDTIPRSQRLLQAQLLNDAEDILYGMLKREGGLKQANLDYLLYVRDVQGRDLIDVVMKKRKPDRTGFEMVARAQTAHISVQKVTDDFDADSTAKDTKPLSASERFRKKRGASLTGEKYQLVLVMGRCYVDSLKGDAAAELLNQKYPTPLPETIFGKPTTDRPSSQTWLELFVNLAEAKKDYAEMQDELKDVLKRPQPTPGPGVKTNEEEADGLMKGPIRYTRELILKTEVEIQMRPALALGCLCFVLIGCPVGIWASRSDYLSVFMICFLPTMFVYYPLLLAGLNLAKNGKVPAWSAWLADAVAFLVAMVLIRRLMKR